jgi:hypothetical protein
MRVHGCRVGFRVMVNVRSAFIEGNIFQKGRGL